MSILVKWRDLGNFKTGMQQPMPGIVLRSQQLDQAIRHRDEARAEECLEEALRRPLGGGRICLGWGMSDADPKGWGISLGF